MFSEKLTFQQNSTFKRGETQKKDLCSITFHVKHWPALSIIQSLYCAKLFKGREGHLIQDRKEKHFMPLVFPFPLLHNGYSFLKSTFPILTKKSWNLWSKVPSGLRARSTEGPQHYCSLRFMDNMSSTALLKYFLPPRDCLSDLA